MVTALKTLVDGRSGGCIPSDDRGLHYGDGLFETCVLKKGRVELWDRHLRRLLEGCRRLGLPPPPSAQLNRELASVCAGHAEGLVKLVITRGSGGRGYRAPDAPRPRRLWQLFQPPIYPPEYAVRGVEVRLCRTRLGSNTALAGVKHLNRLEQVLARSEWTDPAIPEGLLRDSRDRWIEGCMTNLFMVSDGSLFTPRLRECGVAGVMRGLVVDLARERGVPVSICDFDADALASADELFLTNSVVRVWPVRAAGPHHYRIGDLTRELAAAVARHLDGGQG